MIGGLVLAAGEGRRFGAAVKQLAPLEGRPLLEHALAAVAGASVIERAVVVLGAHADEVRAGVALHGVEPVVCRRWASGQAESLRAGVEALERAGADAVVVVLGDQPRIAPAAIDRVVAAAEPQDVAARAAYGGRPGHPVLLRAVLFGAIARLTGDAGARELLASVRVREVPCDGLGSPVDVDTPQALAALSA